MMTEKHPWYHRLSVNQKSVMDCLIGCAKKRGHRVYLVGGAVRDMMMGERAEDLDFAVESGALTLLHEVRRTIGSGTVIELGDSENDTARLVCLGGSFDVSGFRHGSVSIEEDLVLRDFTINSMAVPLDDLLQPDDTHLIDPLDGCGDLALNLVRACSGCFDDDPLRMVRAYRFSAQLGFTIERTTINEIEERVALLSGIAAERISHELDIIMATHHAYRTVLEMRTTGLLDVLIPELYEGRTIQQPPFHHLDVMEHNLETLHCAEQIIADPHTFFPDCEAVDFAGALASDDVIELKWASLFHDVGKPVTRAVDEQQGGRITFYNHDERGAVLVSEIGERLRWKGKRVKRIAALVRMHMHPFHLTNILLQNEKLSKRAKLKICKRADQDLTLLFILAMADSLAGLGPEKPAGMERQLVSMFKDLTEFYQASVQPVIQGPKLLTGHDLIDTFGLEPGPLIGDLLEGLEAAAVEGEITTGSEALAWVEKELSNE